jgi:hypothetical protein
MSMSNGIDIRAIERTAKAGSAPILIPGSLLLLISP